MNRKVLLAKCKSAWIAILIFALVFGGVFTGPFAGIEKAEASNSKYNNEKVSGILGWHATPYGGSFTEAHMLANSDWIAANFLQYGYEYICVDGWVGDSTAHNENGYITKYKNNWVNDWKYWADYLHAKGLKLGIYYNPSWLHQDLVKDDTLKVVGTNIPLRSLIIDNPTYMHQTRYMVNPDAEGSKEYVQGMIKYYINQGVDLLKIDFLRYYENVYGHAAVKKLYDWMFEAAGDDLILYYANTNNVNHAADEVATANLLRASEDWRTDAAQPGVWFHTSNRNKGQTRTNTWPPAYNLFDGFISFADLSGEGKVAIDGDFSVLSSGGNASTDAEKKTRISLIAMAGSSINIGDRYNEMGRNGFYYTNWEILDLNKRGFYAKPLSQDNKNPLSQIWKGQLPDQTWVVALFNREDTPQTRSIDFSADLGLTGQYLVSDMWSHETLGTMSSYSESIAPHSTRMLKISKLTMEPYGAYFSGSQQVELKALHPQAEIRYTTDGSEPSADSTLYTAPFTVSQTTTVRAKIVNGDGQGYDASAMFIQTSADPIDDIAALLTVITAPSPDDTQIIMPEVTGGYSIGIFSSSDESVINRDGGITQPATDKTVNLVLQVRRTADGAAKNTAAIPVKVPGASSGPGGPDPREGIVYPGSTAQFTVIPGGPGTSRAAGGNSITNQYLQFASAPKVNDWIEFTLNVPEAGEYKVEFSYKTNNNRGITQLYVDGIQQGPPVDEYKATQEFLVADLGNVTFTEAGNHTFRFVVTGKTAASSNYNLTFDYIKLIKLVADEDSDPETIANGITSIPAPAKGATQLTLPSVPHGYTISIQQTLNPAVITANGVIIPPDAETTVNLVLEVTRNSDGLSATTDEIPVVVPAKPIGSSNTNIKLKGSHPFVLSVNTSNSTISVLGGATAADIAGQLESTDNSVQSYAVMSTSGSRDSKTPVVKKTGAHLASGDKVIVTAEDGLATKSYTVTVAIPRKTEMPYQVNVVAESLHIPWAFDMAPDRTLYFTERNGKVRLMRNDVVASQPVIDLSANLFLKGESGLLGLVLDPDFATNRYMYVYQSYIKAGTNAANRVLRLKLSADGNTATVDRTLLDDIPATATNGNGNHSGGRIKIGPDGHLYVTTGETYVSSKAQDLKDLGGKILRMALDGSVPADNPFIENSSVNPYVYSYGHRNPQGLAWQSGTNVLYSTEHGDAGHEEVNIIVPGGNYGWPIVEGDMEIEVNGVTLRAPLLHTGTDRLAPSGIAFIKKGPWAGKLFVTNLRGSQLILLSFEDGRIIEEAFFNSDYGRIRDVFEDMDGNIYISSSNHSDPNKDRIVKLTPKSAGQSSDTDIQLKASGHPNLTDVDGASLTIHAIFGTTVAELLAQIESSDGSVQTYAVTDSSDAAKENGALVTGDKLVVTAEDGTTKAIYVVSVAEHVPTAADIAATVTALAAPAKDAAALVLPMMPSGYTVAIKTSSRTDIIALDGKITPPSADTTVTIVLEVTRTSDNSKASTASLTVAVPAKSVPQPPDDSGPPLGNPGNTNVPPVSGNGDKDSYRVSLQELSAHAADGKVTVQAAGDVKRIVLPADAAESLGSHTLAIETETVSFELPAEVIKQLQALAAAKGLSDSEIVLHFNPLAAAAKRRIVATGASASHAQLNVVGEVYELSLAVVDKDGKSSLLTSFNQPITLRLKVKGALNPGLTGIYYIGDNGTLEYVGGTLIDGEMVAEIWHFSKYAILEYKKTFTDLGAKHWAFQPIQELAAKQIVNGTSVWTFEPERAITRAEFAALLANALKLTEAAKISFTDVKATDWYAQPIALAVQAGIVRGKSGSIFDPKGAITREEMVVMLMRAYEAINGAKLGSYTQSKFGDASQVASWAADYVNAAAELGLVKGRVAGQFAPKGITTRAEAAQIIYNLLNKSFEIV
ncbi:putative glucose sorbosone dehydrogenase [Paenibacillus agaridevorans]|uniref:Putative glucose sorbosone dehydrogenase n=1 Tax=Paenibacillus agaridevorans TaxID=171404 RepID=A0A2R5EL54_9BACL|nr:PQQ-dependent sugar dehydrogenase [Paenibacillus agaridevorans]GBG07386.1 putative glucose sorbosone dehydrogenase [Paenibacillus agaridevorans]